MKFLRRVSLTVFLLFVACTTIPYQDDTGFLVSAQANSPEFPVYLNGSLCKDVDGNAGLCSKRIKSTDNLTIHFDAQTYAYQLTMSCTSPMDIAAATVAVNQPFDLVITPAQMASLPSFVCIGEIFPADRNSPVSAKFEIRVVVYDSNYLAREAITFEKKGLDNYLVLGQYARSAWVNDGSGWKQYTKTTEVKIPDPTTVQAYSESFSMRFNTLNLVGPVSQ
jgi:hypothetical protein